MTEPTPKEKMAALVAAHKAKKDAARAQAEADLAAAVPKFDADPEEWRRIGDQGRRARTALIGAAVGADDLKAQEAASRYIRELRHELAGPNPDPLERALADRAALAFFDADRLDRRAALLDTVLQERDAWKPELVDHMDRRRSRAHARALAAARTLAVVRKLRRDVPAVAVQFNVDARTSHPGKPDALCNQLQEAPSKAGE